MSCGTRNPNRLSPADARLLDLEQRLGLPLHVAFVLVFEGDAPPAAVLRDRAAAALDALPRYRQRLVEVPMRQGRPVWAEDPRLHLSYHLRREALPGAGDDAALARLVGRMLAARLDPTKPLWELLVVEGLRGGRFAVIAKTHALLFDAPGAGPDGDSHRDIVATLLDEAADAPPPAPPGREADTAPLPSPAALLTSALTERARSPREGLETLRSLALRVRADLERHDLDPVARLAAPPRWAFNREAGPQRRFAWLNADFGVVRAAKERLGGTVNDVVLAAVAGAIGRLLRAGDQDTGALVLRALIPVADAHDGRLLAAYAPLPVGLSDERRRHSEISRALDGLRDSGRAAAAEELRALSGFAPASMVGAAARLATGERACNLAVTNVPGPDQPRYLLGRRLAAVYPSTPLAVRQTLSIAVVSYAGRVCFGLLCDPDALPDPERLAGYLRESLVELAPHD